MPITTRLAVIQALKNAKIPIYFKKTTIEKALELFFDNPEQTGKF